MGETFQAAESAMVGDSPRRPFQFRLIHLLLVMLVVCVGLAIYVPIARDSIRREHTEQRLRHIAMALHLYHDMHGEFPPAYFCDATGKRVHSWRAMLHNCWDASPQQIVFGYNFNQPWNSPANKAAAVKGAYYLRGPDSGDSSVMTSYVAIVGPNTMWPGETSTRISDFTDGVSNTMMIVEISNSDIHWMEPRDIPVENLDAWLDPQHKPRLGSEISGGFVAFADGSVEFLPRDLARERLRALLSPAGNEAVRRPRDDP